MRSLLWTSVFILLMFELALTFILVVPVPRKWRNWICLKVSKLELKKRLRIPLTCIFFALSLALLDTTTYLQQIYSKENQDEQQTQHQRLGQVLVDSTIDRHLIKEKEYRSARNMYLVGFALTLLFVIGRLTELMQEHAELEEHVKTLTAASSTSGTSSSSSKIVNEGIEMKPIRLKKDDWSQHFLLYIGVLLPFYSTFIIGCILVACICIPFHIHVACLIEQQQNLERVFKAYQTNHIIIKQW